MSEKKKAVKDTEEPDGKKQVNIDRKLYRQIDRQIDIQKDRETDRQEDSLREKESGERYRRT